jgi:2-polyprenyl-3-methyl-5-hydroxy-6-metoxy-1,4-benzoquinol methylase
MIENPFIQDSDVIYQNDIPKNLLVQGYKEQLNINIDSIVSSIDKISVYKCQKSGYQFYYPFEITGDSKFYEELQNIEWYYMPWKWEHKVCDKLIKENSKILEVGCGKGDFLKQVNLQHQDVKCVGLELNKSSVYSADKLEILNKSIEDFSVSNEGKFDIVCSFQVLEHISFVKSFLQAKIRCLKDNGLLVISVPNNDSFIKYDKINVLNMPPHHMGLWTDKSLQKIGAYFNLELLEIIYEPLQEYHFEWYFSLVLKKFTGKFFSRIITKGINLLKLRSVIKKYLNYRANKIKGHTILVVFKKSISKISYK